MPSSLELRYQIFGQGPPLIILHGLFGSSTNWRGIAKMLANHYAVYTLDARNHGNSPWSDVMSYEAMAVDLEHFIQTRQLKNVNVIGHSMGGKTVMLAALRFPELMDKLAVLDIAPVAYSHSHAHHIEAMRSIDFTRIKNRSDADAALKPIISEPSIRQFLLQNLVVKDGDYTWRINLDILEKSMSDLIDFPDVENYSAYTGQTLFLYGGQSAYVQLGFREKIDRLFLNTTFECIEDAGHWLHVEKPAEVVKILRSFLDK